MEKRVRYLLDIISRYVILVAAGILSTGIFYFLFTVLTLYPTYFLLRLFFNALLTGSLISVNGLPIEIIGACVAGSAYYLLLILNLSTRGISVKKRIQVLFFSCFSFLFINILRIFFLSILYVNGISFFDMAHKMLWYAGSILFVVGIWFLSVKIFRIKEVPFYSDILFLLELEKKPEKSKRSKKH